MAGVEEMDEGEERNRGRNEEVSEEEEGEKLRLANILPGLEKWAHSALDTISNELVDVRISPLFLLSSLYFIFSLFTQLFYINV